MERTFSTIVVGTGPAANRLAARLATDDPSLAFVEPEGLTDFPLERVLAMAGGQPEGEESDLPSSVTRISAPVRFENPLSLRVGNDRWHARRVMIATGARPFLPPIQGLSDCGALTAADLLDRPAPSGSFLILGGGPMACTLAFYLQQKNCTVVLLARNGRLLTEEEPEISAAVAESLMSRGARLEMKSRVIQVRRENGKVCAVIEREGTRQEVLGDHFLVAAGLQANSEGMGLGEAGVYIREQSRVVVTDEMRTSVSQVWAAGPVTGANSLNQIENQIRMAAANVDAPFYSRLRQDADPIPFHLPIDPPLARVGWVESTARERWRDARPAVLPLTGGFAKIVARKRSGRILGATLFCEEAGALSLFFNLAFQMEMSVFDLEEPQHYLPLTAAVTARRLIEAWLRPSSPV